jgi:ribose 5-phosphate isomerase B
VRIAIAADHAGYDLKRFITGCLREWGHEVRDLGTDQPDLPDDYPDYAVALGQSIQQQRAERGVLICGSGVGASVAVNKLRGIRAGLCHDTYSAHQGVEHDDMNVIVLGSRIVGTALASDIVRTFIDAEFSNEERHLRRLNKVKALDR